mmetsp:Transcript_17661/g.38490  ORF Transcript_17661/g.38490 Transcript_17661/m.38490 type:complete len:157 (+) Transcript_17661:48-518(+)|eukprot:CAMPEP_0168835298 /NCGR_PEP_ID=MMETSP0727-20121128/4023_1 /TAXON_ID=265536 /ORGANISM="Amphiprora sp., Strain CCMP467" /LENGTH=156 /DNA_ID=CAMNT_0008888653 /DNA_START=39 /DNA_END=509 /DNA_ORIENTATION=-
MLPQDLYTLIKVSRVTVVCDNAKSKGVRDRRFKRRLPTHNNSFSSGAPRRLSNHFPPSGAETPLRGNFQWDAEEELASRTVFTADESEDGENTPPVLLAEIFDDLSLLNGAAVDQGNGVLERGEVEEEKSDDLTFSTSTSTTNSMNSSSSLSDLSN